MPPDEGDPPHVQATVVWRRIPPWHFPKRPRQDRPDSAAFDDDAPGEPMSVIVARPSRNPREALAGHEDFGLVELDVAALEREGLRLVADPQPTEPDHGLVVGPKTKAVRRAMAKSSRWVVRPPAALPPAGLPPAAHRTDDGLAEA